MVYDGVITKPELNEDTLAHYGIKGMKWKKRLKNAYYRGKSKLGETNVGLLRKFNLIKNPAIVTGNDGYNKGDTSVYPKKRKIDYGKANSKSGQEGSRVNEGIAAGRQRALRKSLQNSSAKRPGSRKKKVISGTTSVKKRGVAR